MAIVYKTTAQALAQLRVYDASTATYSANLAGTAAHSLFPDDADVGDIIYFGASQKFVDLSFNIGTALVASSITVAWEYYNAYTRTWDALTVTDNTNAFQNTGIQTVLFKAPRLWSAGYNAFRPASVATDYWWVRCRITAASGVTEGGANQTTAIAGLKSLVIVTGTYTDVFPSLYAADAGAWGVIERELLPDQAEYSYIVSSQVQFGDGSTATAVTGKNDLVHTMDNVSFYDTANAVVTLDQIVFINHTCNSVTLSGLVNLTYGTVQNAVEVEHHNDFPGTSKNVASKNLVRFMIVYGRMSRWSGYAAMASSGSSGTSSYVLLPNGTFLASGAVSRSIAISANYPYGSGRWIGHQLSVLGSTVSNFAVAGTQTHIIYNELELLAGGSLSDPALHVMYQPSANNVYITYPFRLRVVDSSGNPLSGVTVTMSNAAGVQPYGFDYTTAADVSGPLTTDANGAVPLSVLPIYKHYNSSRSGNWKWGDATVNYNPWTIVLSKTGYQTRTLIYTVNGPVNDVEMLSAGSGSAVIVIED